MREPIYAPPTAPHDRLVRDVGWTLALTFFKWLTIDSTSPMASAGFETWLVFAVMTYPVIMTIDQMVCWSKRIRRGPF